MAVSDFHEKKQARVERYTKLAEKNKTASTLLCNEAVNMTKVIPMGQPILVGHHSEAGHRRLLQRSDNTMRKAVEAGNKADYYAGKATAAENNNAISSDDPEAVVKLKEKLERLQIRQDYMKRANKIIRSKRLTEEEKIEQLKTMKLSEESIKNIMDPNQFGGAGFASFQLTNNNAKIKNTQKRLEQLQKQATEENKEWEVKDLKVVDDVRDNRLRIYFEEKPEIEIRKRLRSSSFRYSYRFECWQAFRTAKYKLETFLKWYQENY